MMTMLTVVRVEVSRLDAWRVGLTGVQRLRLRGWGKLFGDERVRDRVYARSHDGHRGVLFQRLEQLTPKHGIFASVRI